MMCKRSRYAREPVNGKLPIGPMPISPLMLSPETLPVNSSVSGIGLVIETFQETSSPLTVPSKISPLLPSAPCVPVSVEPEVFRLSVALRSRRLRRLRPPANLTWLRDPG